MEGRATTTVRISARQISESGVVDDSAPQTHGWVYRLDGLWKSDQEAIDEAIRRARGRYGATHENFKFDKGWSCNYAEIPDPQAPRGYRFEKLYDYERGEG